jgi:hypothetical protein
MRVTKQWLRRRRPPNGNKVKIRIRHPANNCFDFAVVLDKNKSTREQGEVCLCGPKVTDQEYSLQVYPVLRKAQHYTLAAVAASATLLTCFKPLDPIRLLKMPREQAAKRVRCPLRELTMIF